MAARELPEVVQTVVFSMEIAYDCYQLRLFLSFCGDIVSENIIKSAIKSNIVHVFKHTELKFNGKSSKYTDIHNDSKEIVS